VGGYNGKDIIFMIDVVLNENNLSKINKIQNKQNFQKSKERKIYKKIKII
jgi:hypothetical protein